MALLKQSTARDRMVFMCDETDHITGLASLSLTITASKNGAAFAGISPTVTDRGDGWYSLALTTTHTNTLGDFAMHITATGADPTDALDEVVLSLPGEGDAATLTAIDALPTNAELATALAAADDAVLAAIAAGDAAWTTVIPNSINTAGVRPTPLQALLGISRALLTRRRASGSDLIYYEEDNSTPSITLAMDDPITPTDVSRTS